MLLIVRAIHSHPIYTLYCTIINISNLNKHSLKSFNQRLNTNPKSITHGTDTRYSNESCRFIRVGL